ncbi:MocR-like pyridoxine biosynthesis transcription factor PdxR [Bacillus changyiensis]|uniref:MocR-like pyridoxine biosynthesis transcription factor PdxR n=1 Tax=Bacillus changyiensis TaxID=3004103 RepID=UPI0022E84DCF|nr:PLP-dependent aminotransferase family protein [Bacillus changyiensis]MDA1478075.1 PLP-dependent aminotransferase family protein [Bacillus changyiensis]
MLLIPINRLSTTSLTGQVYQYIRDQVLNGKIKPGEKLPSTRELSSHLCVSRNVILTAYEQLIAEGFIVTYKGSGSYIAEGTYLKQEKIQTYKLNQSNEKSSNDNDMIDFRSGVPALDFFPRKIWARLSNITWHETRSSMFGYDVPEGRIELREAILNYLNKTRQVFCHPDHLIITSGAVQALTLVSSLLLKPNGQVVIEDPIKDNIQKIFKSSGAFLYPIPVDRNGINTDLLPTNKNPKFVFFTPSHQFPLGGTLSVERQIDLINYARKKDCYLVEDDYDSEFRYESTPVSSSQGLAPERVIYIGTLSNILSPSLRLGYLILPPHLVEKCRNLKKHLDLHTPTVNQLILAQFIEQRYLERHILKMKKLYKKRRDYLIKRLYETFSNRVNIFGYSTGLHLIVEFKGLQFTKEIINNIEKFKVKIYSVEDHTIQKGMHVDKIIIGYGHLTEEQINEGITRLSKAINHIL